MTEYRYASSASREWLAVAATGRLLVTKTDGDAERMAALGATATDRTSVQQVLELLTAGGLAATGPFALVFWVSGSMASNGLGVIVRGEAAVSVQTSDGTVTVRSQGVTTWTEQVIENATSFSVDTGASSDGILLPFTGGAAWASTVELVSADSTDETRAPDVASASDAPTEPGDDVDGATGAFHTQVDIGATTAESAVETGSYDYLFGATAAPTSTLGDHDGDTLLTADIIEARRLHQAAVAEEVARAERARAEQAAAAQRPPAAAPLPQQPPAPQPPTPVDARPFGGYVLELPGGARQPLTAPVILGRAPSVSQVAASVLPHLVTVLGDDISRSHVRVSVEGDTVVVTDLHSSNGTQIVAPGKLPQLLRGGEPTPVITGTVIDLGSAIVFRVVEV